MQLAFLPILTIVFYTSTLRAEKPAKEIATVKVTEVKAQELFDEYDYPISLESKKESQVYSEITGVVKDVLVKIGQPVKAEQPLILLQHTLPEYSYAPFNVKSPISGVVAAIARKTGARVQTGDILIHIVNRSDLTMFFEIPEAELSLLKNGLPGEVDFRVLKDAVPVAITGISPLVNPQSGTAKGELAWSGKIPHVLSEEIASKLFPGMVGNVSFKLNDRQGLAVPKDAVAFQKGEYVVRTVKDNKVRKAVVTLGKDKKDQVEILSGLALGDLIIVSQGKYLKENEEVKVDDGKNL